MSTKIFLSVGRTFTSAQEEFVSELESFLQAHDLIAQTVGRTYFSSEQPLRAIMNVLRECSGAVILAFERVFIKQGCEKRGSPKESPLEETNLPTVWNQIEAAIAYILGHPLMVVIEKGLRSEGLLETGYDWYVQWVDMDASELRTREFAGVFSDWKKRVEEYQKVGVQRKPKDVDPEKLTLGQILGALKPAQLWALIVTLVGALSAVAATAYNLGAMLANKP